MSKYLLSESMLNRAEKTIPLASQTFSKSKTHYPFGVSPYFIKRGKGSKVWDVDGNEYTDFINSLCAITLGYNDVDVVKAVKEQLEEGTIFSLPHPIEFEVSEKIVEMIPCADMVRYGKNGSDATAGAVRVARAYTQRDRVAVCGYHGWQDWYIGSTTRNKGVPQVVRDQTHSFQYNNIDSLKKIFDDFPDQIACVILEPMNVTEPQNNFLQEVLEYTHSQGALLIFDETVTGFRFANGGAQQYFGVTPDLATFGKGLANGFPISVVAGKEKYMRLMEEIFFSFTFGGETLSLAASLATLKKLQAEPVIETLYKQGSKIIEGVNNLIQKHDLKEIVSISGNPTWSFLNIAGFNDYNSFEIKTLFLQEIFDRGILSVGTHNLSYSHSDQDITKLLNVYDEVFSILQKAIFDKSLVQYLKCKPLEPLFKVR